MGFGLTPEAVMHMAYVFMEKCQRSYPFKNEKAGSRDSNHEHYCSYATTCRALCSNKETL